MKIETTIYTIRHARTRYNEEKRYAGTMDISLDDSGIREAREAAKNLNGFGFDIVIASALKRSIETARILVDNKTPIVQSKLCNERSFGIMEGLTWENVQNLNPPVLFMRVGGGLHSVNPKGGEPFEDLWERAKQFNRHIFSAYKGKNVLVVSHAVFLQSFHGLLRGLSCLEALAVPYPSNNELNALKFWGGELMEEKRVQLLNDNGAQW